MNDINALAVSQLDDPCYLKSVTHLGDTCPIVANSDMHSDSGIKLVSAGMHINSSLSDRLLKHKLARPLDQYLSVENSETGDSLSALTIQLMMDDHRLALIESTQFEGWKIPFVMKQVTLAPAIAFKLTVMRETQPNLFRHSLYIAIVSIYLGMKLRLEKRQLINLATAALLHDIGILHVDPSLLEQDHKMTEMERRHLYVHPVTSWLILKTCPEYLPEVLDAVLQHHERLDGSGYPRGLKSDEIGPIGQIIAVAEIVASRYGNEDAEYGWARLETILKLNLRRYGANLIRHLKVFYQSGNEVPACSAQDKQVSRDRMKKIVMIFSAWDTARGQCDMGSPLCDFVTERMSSLKMEIIDAGLNPSADEQRWLDMHDDPRACFDAKILLDEALWQLYGIQQEIRRRWPSIDTETSSCDCGAVRSWMKEVEQL